MVEPRLLDRNGDGLSGGSGLAMDGGTVIEAMLSGQRVSTWDTDSVTDCSQESL